MPSFAYTALDRTGQTTTGTMTAESRPAAIAQIESRGLVPVEVRHGDAKRQTEGNGSSHPGRARSPARVGALQVEAFIRELANLLAAGVSLNRALNILHRQASNTAAKTQWKAILDDVTQGQPLADALARWPRSFPTVFIAMIRAGETGGFLDTALTQVADFRQRERDLLGRVKAAMIYPAVLAVLMVAVLVFLLTYFIPVFSKIFNDFGAALPALTRGILWVSAALTHYGLVVVGAALLLVLVGRRAAASDAGRRWIDRALLATPGVGVALARFALVRFTRMLGTLLGAGVPMVTALRVARQAIGSQTLSDAVGRAIDDVQQGASLAVSLGHCPRLFPPSVIEMVAVAEESGRLDSELVRLGGAYESDLDRRLRMLVSVIEPAMLFVMASLIGTVIIGMLLPVFTLQELIK